MVNGGGSDALSAITHVILLINKLLLKEVEHPSFRPTLRSGRYRSETDMLDACAKGHCLPTRRKTH